MLVQPSTSELSVQTPSLPVLCRRSLLLALVGLAGCATVAGVPPALPVAGNELRILVFRGGAAARLGHNHVLAATDLRVEWPAAGPLLRFRLDGLAVDPPALRQRLGADFSSVVGDADRDGTRANLLKALDAADHPEVVVRTLQQQGEGARRAVEAEITLHGVTRRQWFVAEVDGPQARGQLVVRQSDFGIQPFAVLGGLLAVQDALVVQFELRQP